LIVRSSRCGPVKLAPFLRVGLNRDCLHTADMTRYDWSIIVLFAAIMVASAFWLYVKI
jgi:hypothetical protein